MTALPAALQPSLELYIDGTPRSLLPLKQQEEADLRAARGYFLRRSLVKFAPLMLLIGLIPVAIGAGLGLILFYFGEDSVRNLFEPAFVFGTMGAILGLMMGAPLLLDLLKRISASSSSRAEPLAQRVADERHRMLKAWAEEGSARELDSSTVDLLHESIGRENRQKAQGRLQDELRAQQNRSTGPSRSPVMS